MRFPFFSKTIDTVDLTAAAILGVAVFFVVAFSWRASAGAARSDLALLQELAAEARKRVDREQRQIGHLLSLEAAGDLEQVRRMVQEAAGRWDGNSQFYLLAARLGRNGEETGEVLGAYRRALELNRDYSDRRSEFYLGEELRPLLRGARKRYLDEGGPQRSGLLRDLFFIERALAGGCH